MLDLGRTLLYSVERRPDSLALVDGETRLSYAQWFSRIAAAARGLRDIGLRPGDHLLTCLQNRWEAATLHWACQFLGVIITPLNWRAKSDEIDYCLRDAQAKAIVFEAANSEAVASAQTVQDLPRIGLAHESIATMYFGDWIAQREANLAPSARAEDWSLMLYTSGTTGKPKGVPRRHRAERAAALAHVAQNQYAVGERTLGVMPLYHTMGVRSLLAMAMIDGTFVCVPRFDAAACLALIERERVTNLYLVPTLYHDLISDREFSAEKVNSVHKLGFAGAPMHAALLKRVCETFNPSLFVNHYGSSEIYTFTINQNATRKPGSAGRAGVNARIRVVSLGAVSSHDLAASNQEGQIIADLAGDEAFEGYWKRPDADAKSIRDGWYFTGDTGYFDQDGDLFVTGRVDDMIISGGENISPMDIESVLSLHPAVEEVAVAGLQDERWGQRVVAFVKRRSSVDSAALDMHCKSSGLANFRRPREYVFLQEIPKSSVGKILRRKLVAGDYLQD